MDSDDSDFYGDVTTVAQFNKRAHDFNVDQWLQQQRSHPGYPRRQTVSACDEGASRLHNPYDGVPSAWQLTETINEFLKRLPPATTDQNERCPWIFVCNPYIPRVHKDHSEMHLTPGNETEAPEEQGARTALIIQGGMERLHLVTSFAEGIRTSGRTKAFIEKEIKMEGARAAEDILYLAHMNKVRTGKWMLFCTVTEVNEIWEIVARATANNELGIAAKVAPRPQDSDSRKERLLCVYTQDFADKADVKRVLLKLRELRVIDPRRRPIYYKPDAFTYIGIASGNPWGMRASLYSSADAIFRLPTKTNVSQE